MGFKRVLRRMRGFSGRKHCDSSLTKEENEVYKLEDVVYFSLLIITSFVASRPNFIVKMSDANVSPIVGQEVWAAVSVVFCVAVILVFFCILCCAYRRHRRVRDLTMFTPPVLDELGTHSSPWVVCNTKHEPHNKWTSGV